MFFLILPYLKKIKDLLIIIEICEFAPDDIGFLQVQVLLSTLIEKGGKPCKYQKPQKCV